MNSDLAISPLCLLRMKVFKVVVRLNYFYFFKCLISVTARGVKHTYDKLAELPFDSFRKCMTVIVKVQCLIYKTIHFR